MQAGAETLATIANHWLARFEQALAAADESPLAALFEPESHWRDLIAFSGRIRTLSGSPALAARLAREAALVRPGGFRTHPQRTPARHATRAGTRCIEAIFRFDTA